MAHSRRPSGEVNAGSMADIAFLLLIFFLVVSTIDNDVGINRKLPKKCLTEDCISEIHSRNLLTIKLNEAQEILIDNELTDILDVKLKIMNFLDNNGDSSCLYCSGKQLTTASDNPKKAVVSILTTRDTNYEWFISVQDELISAYYDLRLVYVKKQYGKPLTELSNQELLETKKAYPLQVSEAELQ